MASRWVGTIVFFCGLLAGCGATESVRENEASNERATTAENVSRPEVQKPSKPIELPPAPEPDKKIYAKSVINRPAPTFIVEEWLTKQPERAGKMVLIDFWATWCKPCRDSIPKLNQFHQKHKDRLAIIGVSDETSEEVRDHKAPRIHYAVAVDPQRRLYDELEIQAIPHLILVDPFGIVRWEGLPTLKGYELTDEVLDDLLDTYVP
jgi:thiol-disulfide isomerase/thioredoxin